jgi:hypothetical protein
MNVRRIAASYPGGGELDHGPLSPQIISLISLYLARFREKCFVDFLIQRMTLRGILLRWVLPGFVKMFGVILHEYVRDLPTIELQLNTVRGLLPYLPVFGKMLRVSA